MKVRITPLGIASYTKDKYTYIIGAESNSLKFSRHSPCSNLVLCAGAAGAAMFNPFVHVSKKVETEARQD